MNKIITTYFYKVSACAALFVLMTAGSVQALTAMDYIWQRETVSGITTNADDLITQLETHIVEMMTNANPAVDSGMLQPILVDSGLGGPYYLYGSPAETVHILSDALPLLSASVQTQLQAYIDSFVTEWDPLTWAFEHSGNNWGSRTLVGNRREYGPMPTNKTFNIWPPPALPLESLYAVWRKADVSGDWTYISNNWSDVVGVYSNYDGTPDRYGEVLGLIAMSRICHSTGNTNLRDQAEALATTAIAAADYTNWLEVADSTHINGGHDWSYPLFHFVRTGPVGVMFAPELGRLIAEEDVVNAQADLSYYIGGSNEHAHGAGSVPAWMQIRGEYQYGEYLYKSNWLDQLQGGENLMNTPDLAWTFFHLRKYVFNDPAEVLHKWVDTPLCVGDLCYIQTLSSAIRAYGSTTWSPLRDLQPEIALENTSITVSEGGTTTNLRVKLTQQPTNAVSVNIGRISGDSDISIAGATNLTFTTNNWSAWQSVTVQAAEDGDDTDGSAVVRCSGSGMADADVTVTEVDNDDVTAPTVQSYNPSDGATNVAVAANLVLTFDEDMLKGSGNVVIRHISDNTAFETIGVAGSEISIAGTQVTVNPTGSFATLTDYYVEIDSGALTDLATNDFAGISGSTTWNFTTTPGDVTAASVTNVTCTNRTLVTVSFDESLDSASAENADNYDIDNGIKVFAAQLQGDGQTVDLLTTYLSTGTTYELIVNGVEDLGFNTTVATQQFTCGVVLSSGTGVSVSDGDFSAYDNTTDYTAGTTSDEQWYASSSWARSATNGNPDAWMEFAIWSGHNAVLGVAAPSGNETWDVSFDWIMNRAAHFQDGFYVRGVMNGDVVGRTGTTWDGDPIFSDTSLGQTASWVNKSYQISITGGYDHIVFIIRGGSDSSGQMGFDNLDVQGGAAPDTNAPAAVTGLSVAPSSGLNTISWQNPADTDYEGVLVLRRAGAAPTGTPADGTVYAPDTALGDGVVVHTTAGTNRTPGSVSTYEDAAVTNGVTYYYEVFSADHVPNYSASVGGSGTPSGTPINNAPSVEAGTAANDILYGSSTDLVMNATVSDDGLPSGATNILWSLQSGPGSVSFSPSATVEDPTVTFTNTGAYTLLLTVDDSEKTNSDTVVVTLDAPDLTAPVITNLLVASQTGVSLGFSEALDGATVSNTANYSIDNGITVSGAALADGTQVQLTLSSLSTGITYTLTVTNVADLAGNPVAAGTQTNFSFYAPSLIAGSGQATNTSVNLTAMAQEAAQEAKTMFDARGGGEAKVVLVLNNASASGSHTEIRDAIYAEFGSNVLISGSAHSWHDYTPHTLESIPEVSTNRSLAMLAIGGEAVTAAVEYGFANYSLNSNEVARTGGQLLASNMLAHIDASKKNLLVMMGPTHTPLAWHTLTGLKDVFGDPLPQHIKVVQWGGPNWGTKLYNEDGTLRSTAGEGMVGILLKGTYEWAFSGEDHPGTWNSAVSDIAGHVSTVTNELGGVPDVSFMVIGHPGREKFEAIRTNTVAQLGSQHPLIGSHAGSELGHSNTTSDATGDAGMFFFVGLKGGAVAVGGPDQDNDGMDDSWEQAQFGDTTTATTNTDFDGDGMLDWQEFITGTQPTNASSLFRISQATGMPGTGNLLTWDAITGRYYQVEWGTNLISSPFAVLISNVTAAADGSISFTDTLHQAEQRIYYRLNVRD